MAWLFGVAYISSEDDNIQIDLFLLYNYPIFLNVVIIWTEYHPKFPKYNCPAYPQAPIF
jgi:hypothetical protein